MYKISYIKDIMGNNYLGIKFTYSQIEKYINKLKKILEDDFDLFISNQQKRDLKNNSYYTHHLTLLNVMEYNKLIKQFGSSLPNKIKLLQSLEISDLNMKGIGMVTKNNNKTYFIVVSSDILDEVRKSFNLPKKDFHITLGFNKKDIFGVSKDKILWEI